MSLLLSRLMCLLLLLHLVSYTVVFLYSICLFQMFRFLVLRRLYDFLFVFVVASRFLLRVLILLIIWSSPSSYQSATAQGDDRLKPRANGSTAAAQLTNGQRSIGQGSNGSEAAIQSCI